MARRVYNLSGSETAMFLNVMRRLEKHDEDRLVEAQLKHERENPERYRRC